MAKRQNNGLVTLFGAGSRRVLSRAETAVSADYPNVELLGVTNTDAPRTITLLSAQISVSGFAFEIQDESGGAGANNITIETEGSETIGGASSIAITENGAGVQLYADGANVFSR